MNFLSHLECPKCGAKPDAGVPQNLCPDCGAPLLVRYRLAEAKQHLSPDVFAAREKTMWRYRELLPVQDTRNIVSLGEGFTPILPAANLGRQIESARGHARLPRRAPSGHRGSGFAGPPVAPP